MKSKDSDYYYKVVRKNIKKYRIEAKDVYKRQDLGRDAIERVFARVLKGEKALVRNQFISGSHALSTALFALLRPKDTMLSITGLPYDTLHEVIGIKENKSSLKSFHINYEPVSYTHLDVYKRQVFHNV